MTEHSETSMDAYRSIDGDSQRLRAVVLRMIAGAPNGLTCDEIEVVTGMRHQTASARINELAKRMQIQNYDGEKRRTRSGRSALVWRLCVSPFEG
jgi:Fic family protein